VANPAAGIIGSPLSGALLGITGKGLSGWQWMFLMEGMPAILLGVVVYWTLSDRPEEAAWLKGEERAWLLDKQAEEKRAEEKQQAASGAKPGNFWQVLIAPRIWGLSLVYFGVSTTMYGVTLWLPSVIQSLSGLSNFWTGVVAILPFLVTAVAMVLVGARSDRTGERRWHTAIPAFVGAGALIAAGYGTSTVVVVACIGLGLACAESMVGPFWAMATSRMAGLSAAAGIAVINSLANLGGYFGPDIIGFFRARGGFRGGLVAIGTTVAVSGMMALIVGRKPAENT
jgi:ACS family tartrate transporter-like MFS transporter